MVAALFAVFTPVLVLCAGLCAMAWRVERRIVCARHWPRAQGRIISARMGRSKARFWPDIRYDYEAGGRLFRGKRLGFVQRSREEAECLAVIERYAPGTPVTAYYDPTNPAFAILEVEGDGGPYRMAALYIGGSGLIALAVLLLAGR